MDTLLSSIKKHANINHITADSRQVKAGSLFVAYKGDSADGRAYIYDAINQGASAVVWEKDGFVWNTAWKIPNQPLLGLKKEIGAIASEFYGMPSNKLWMVGVTGTNGKTTCSHWLAQAFSALGLQSAVIGTLGNGLLTDLSKTNNTTPDVVVLHGLLAEYLAQQAKVVAMEVSSHGLDQGRINGVNFDVAVFTNLTRDHLDYHGDMQAYGEAKKKLFTWSGLKTAVINRDDAFGLALADELSALGTKVITYGLNEAFVGENDIAISSVQLSDVGMTLEVVAPEGKAIVSAPVVGQFNAYNLLAVLATLLASDIALADAVVAMTDIRPVVGRMQQCGGGKYPLIVIDYAHTPDALEQVLKSLRAQLTPNAELTCVFGCGGDRDQGKRSLMGKVAAGLANHVIVTSDNPRNETAASIIHAVMVGAGNNAKSIENRAEAIRYAINHSKKGDVVLVAGKGHEEFQEIAGVKYPFSDIKEAQEALLELET